VETPDPSGPPEIDEQSPKVACKFCRSEIEYGAAICPICRSYQAGWKNMYIVFLGGLSGLAILASAITYTYINIVKPYTMTDGIRVVYMEYPGPKGVDPNGDALISNFGEGDIFISDVVFEYNFLNGVPGDYDVPLNYDLKKGATSNVSLKLREFAMFVNTMNRDFGLVVANKSGKISEKLFAEAFSYNSQKCVSVRFVTTTHPQFTRMSHYYNAALSKELAVMPIRAHINIVPIALGCSRVSLYPMSWRFSESPTILAADSMIGSPPRTMRRSKVSDNRLAS
jgi:RNA polymerase subunit RPABC4/transcription elongation factor Spt4